MAFNGAIILNKKKFAISKDSCMDLNDGKTKY
jgi:hypothetical protein